MITKEQLVRVAKNPSGAVSYLVRRTKRNVPMWYFKLISDNHTEAARKFMRYRTRQDSQRSVGGWDHGIGELQLEFLKAQGLEPQHRLLDIGCGSLRAGQHFMRFLDCGNYAGMDISAETIEEGKDLVEENLLDEAAPTFVVNDDLHFAEFADEEPFDYLISQSVFTHLPKDEIRECFAHVSRVMHENSRFYATFFDTADYDLTSLDMYDFAYDPEELVSLGSEYGFSVSVLPRSAYPHPRDQRMLEIIVEE